MDSNACAFMHPPPCAIPRSIDQLDPSKAEQPGVSIKAMSPVAVCIGPRMKARNLIDGGNRAAGDLGELGIDLRRGFCPNFADAFGEAWGQTVCARRKADTSDRVTAART